MNSSSCSALACIDTEARRSDLFSSVRLLILNFSVSISIFKTRFSCSRRSREGLAEMEGEELFGGGGEGVMNEEERLAIGEASIEEEEDTPSIWPSDESAITRSNEQWAEWNYRFHEGYYEHSTITLNRVCPTLTMADLFELARGISWLIWRFFDTSR